MVGTGLPPAERSAGNDGARPREVGSSDPRNTLNFRELRGSCCQMS